MSDLFEPVFKTIVFLVFVVVFVGVGGLVFGYGCKGCKSNSSSLALKDAYCTPVLDNGDPNPHYRNSWNSCTRMCRNSGMPMLNIKTCNCSCQIEK